MLFSSNVFIYVFFPLCFLLYYACKKRAYRNTVLVIFSIMFYAWGEPVYIMLMMLSCLINYVFALLINRYKDGSEIRKILLAFDVGINIAILGYFKYSGFLVTNINQLLHTNFEVKEIALPIGISFFTFQAMSYVIDVYRHDGKVQKNLLNVVLYISLFPQLIAGPIVRYQTIAEQIEDRNENLKDISDGLCRFVIGLGKKVLLSNVFATVADNAFTYIDGMSVAMAWLGAIAYTLQIYFDFSGYSDMAIGMGKMFGFGFLENFNYPYISKSITEFWRRWHISLGTWFRDYVYIPLGGNRKGGVRQIINLSVVWFLTGLWHGANWTFVAWGIYYLMILIIEKFLLMEILSKSKVISHLYTMILVIIGWVLFRAESISSAILYIKTMFFCGNVNILVDQKFYYYFLQLAFWWIVGIIASLPLAKNLVGKLEIWSMDSTKKQVVCNLGKLIWCTLIFCITMSSLAANAYNPFIYFNF